MKGLVKNWIVCDEPRMSERRIIRIDIEGSYEAEIIVRNPRRIEWDDRSTVISEELQTVVEDLKKSHHWRIWHLAKTVTSTVDAPWQNRNLVRMRTEVRKPMKRFSPSLEPIVPFKFTILIVFCFKCQVVHACFIHSCETAWKFCFVPEEPRDTVRVNERGNHLAHNFLISKFANHMWTFRNAYVC